MKKIIIILLFVNILFAKSEFWQKITEIENKYYPIISKQLNEKAINDMIDKKYSNFNQLIAILKNKPYDLTDDSYFNLNEKNRLKLLQRIKTNKTYGYNLAVQRDKIKLATLKLKEKFYIYFVTLANSWVNFKSDDLEKLTQENLEYLARINYTQYFVSYDRVKKIDGKIENQIKTAFQEFDKHYLFFNEFLAYIIENKQIFKYESLSNILKLGVLIDKINSNNLFKEINTKLRFVHLDMGRVILFIFVVIFSIFLSYIVYKRIYALLRKKIYLKHDDIDDILLNNLNKIRKPISFLIVLIGLKISLDILIYPNSLEDNISNSFYIIVVLNVVYLLFIFIDNTILIYLTNKNDDNIRKELVALIVSISKIIIFFIGILLILVNFKVDISGILASLGIGGLAVALAAQSTLSNFFGLIKMIADKSFSIGDWIQTSDVEGTVVNIGFISTKIRTFDNALITVPNSALANSAIKNWNKRKIGRRIKMHLGLTYSSQQKDLKNAIKEIKVMLQNHPGIVTSNKVDYSQINKYYRQEQKLTSIDDKYGIKTTLLVYLDKFNDSSIDILIYTFTNTTSWDKWLEIKEDVLLKIWTIIEQNNLEFAFPSQSIYMEKTKY